MHAHISFGCAQSTHDYLMDACMNAHTGYPAVTSPLLALLPSSLQSSGVASLQEISKETVYTTSSKEIIIIITLSDLAVKFLQKGWMSSRGGGWGCWTAREEVSWQQGGPSPICFAYFHLPYSGK